MQSNAMRRRTNNGHEATVLSLVSVDVYCEGREGKPGSKFPQLGTLLRFCVSDTTDLRLRCGGEHGEDVPKKAKTRRNCILPPVMMLQSVS